MIKPYENEKYSHFVSRFMKDKDMIKEYPEVKKRFAIMASEWRNR